MPNYPINRRFVLKVAAFATLLAALPQVVYGFFLKRFPVRTVENKGFSFDSSSGIYKDRQGREAPFQLVVNGLVEKPLRLSWRELNDLPQVEQVNDFHCVEGWSVPDLKWGGVKPGYLLAMAGIKKQASHVVFHALGETRHKPGGLKYYVECNSIDELKDPAKQMLLAHSLNGSPLPLEHGAPLRLISPFDLAYKSIKFVWRLEVTDSAVEGWWTRANPIYPYEAPVPPERLRKKS
ncbi:molybdopterin-dependent oxidoreductase [Dethiosulfatarculus sandiegensis]|uniref:Sulfite dehydrogenase n=1 Tax=Dethiosulfatarculus sandiegensis TaxID=1429043 RepID=A0A0D2J653_9BACT|nr:molybdopterin-dependent oxidoreductase [Dethiosulfatarculus sandiegensis]KIX13619.1 sulfite dehydrogenase [Dethiosulfatarculus sandiegensis]